MVNEKRNLTKEDGMFFGALIVFALFYILRYFEHTMSQYNTTLFALSYKYGFISRGMVGTIWLGLDHALPINLMTYEAVYWFTVGMTLVYFAVFFLFFVEIMRRVPEEKKGTLRYLIVFFCVLVFPEFLGDEMFGRLDLYLFILTMVCVILLVKDCAIWMIVPISMLCVCIHQGFVFTNVNIILVLLFYKAMMNKNSKKYGILFALTFLSVSVLFLYFEFFSHGKGVEIYGEIVSLAKSLSEDGASFNESIINHEILGKDVFEDERLMHLDNYHELPVALLLWSPYIVMGLGFLKNLIKGEKGKSLLAYLAVALGGITILPEMVLKVDYGRYFFLLFFYYVLVLICLYVMGDQKVIREMERLKSDIKRVCPVPLVVLAYPMFLMPFFDVLVSPAVYKLSVWIFGEVL